jgi:hypothetical protein
MRRSLILSSLAALALAAAPAGTGAAPAQQTQVLCVDKHNDLVYRVTPKACTFHKRNAPFANAFEVITRHDHWRHWGGRRARGKGKALASMTGPSPVRIRLYRARTRCGHRVFTKARFRYPTFHSGGALRLDSCKHSP